MLPLALLLLSYHLEKSSLFLVWAQEYAGPYSKRLAGYVACFPCQVHQDSLDVCPYFKKQLG